MTADRATSKLPGYLFLPNPGSRHVALNFHCICYTGLPGGVRPRSAPSSEPGDGAHVSPAIIVSEAEVVREAGISDYKLSWATNVSDAPVRIEVSADPDFPLGQGSVIADGLKDTSYTFTAPAGALASTF